MPYAEEIVTWLQARVREAGARGVVCGVSGGVDSAVTAALGARAVGPENVLAVLMPCHSQPLDAQLGREVAQHLGVPVLLVDLSAPYDTLLAALPPSDVAMAAANVKPRLRMTTLYYLAQSRNALVLGGGNKTEISVGYFTKWGDSGVDLLPIGNLYKSQVWELARELGLPQAVIDRPPTAGLWPGQTDEGEMGITYHELDRVLQAIEAGRTAGIDPAVLAKVQAMIARSAHKRSLPPAAPAA